MAVEDDFLFRGTAFNKKTPRLVYLVQTMGAAAREPAVETASGDIALVR